MPKPKTRPTEAQIAAIINSIHGFTEVVAEYRRGNKIVIAERMLSKSVTDESTLPYRVKLTQYKGFYSRKAALAWMRENGCKNLIEYGADTDLNQ